MSAMAPSTAGAANGFEPTYCTKWSTICATLALPMCLRTTPPRVCPMRSASTSDRVDSFMLARRSSVSPMPSTLFQKKKRSEMPCSRSDCAR